MDPSLKPATAVERIAGNLVVEGTLTAVAALAGGPLAALLPVLSNSLAAARQRERIEAALMHVDTILRQHSQALQGLSDAQYKLLNESVLALLHTTDERKIEYLRNAVRNCLTAVDLLPDEAIALSRIVRDISAGEAKFLFNNFRYRRLQLWRKADANEDDEVLTIEPDSKDGAIVSGLISLGLVVGSTPLVNDVGRYSFSPLVAKLLVVLREVDRP